jgi:hypothetical protein
VYIRFIIFFLVDVGNTVNSWEKLNIIHSTGPCKNKIIKYGTQLVPEH